MFPWFYNPNSGQLFEASPSEVKTLVARGCIAIADPEPLAAILRDASPRFPTADEMASCPFTVANHVTEAPDPNEVPEPTFVTVPDEDVEVEEIPVELIAAKYEADTKLAIARSEAPTPVTPARKGKSVSK